MNDRTANRRKLEPLPILIHVPDLRERVRLVHTTTFGKLLEDGTIGLPYRNVPKGTVVPVAGDRHGKYLVQDGGLHAYVGASFALPVEDRGCPSDPPSGAVARALAAHEHARERCNPARSRVDMEV